MLALPVWPRPFALSGKPAPATFQGHQWVHAPPDMKPVLDDFDAESIFSEVIKPHLFARMLAKIAHSHTIAVFGPGSFKPVLTPLILNEGERYIEFVGSSPDIDPPEPATTLMTSFEVFPRETDGALLGIFNFRLFANIGAPTYHIVVGEMEQVWLDQAAALDKAGDT